MNSNLIEGYMDDIRLGGTSDTMADDIMLSGKSDTVTDDVATMRTLSSTLGLHFNAKKCELIHHCPTTTEPAFRDFVIKSKREIVTWRTSVKLVMAAEVVVGATAAVATTSDLTRFRIRNLDFFKVVFFTTP